MIGIRQADGSFYEILDETAAGHKRLILSAARTDQKGVRIELFRSADGSISPEGSLGEIALEDSAGLGYQDIEFRLDVADGRLDASAALPGQPPRTLSVELGDAPPRSDASILEDDSLGAELDTLDASFLEPEAEPATLDLPDLRVDESEMGAAPESFDMPELDDFELPGLDEPTGQTESSDQAEVAEPEGLADPDVVSEPESEAEPELESFDMPEMDDMAPLDDFSALEEPDLAAPLPEAAETEEAIDEFSMDAFDDSEPMPIPSLDETTMEPDVAAPLPEAEDPFRSTTWATWSPWSSWTRVMSCRPPHRRRLRAPLRRMNPRTSTFRWMPGRATTSTGWAI